MRVFGVARAVGTGPFGRLGNTLGNTAALTGSLRTGLWPDEAPACGSLGRLGEHAGNTEDPTELSSDSSMVPERVMLTERARELHRHVDV